MLASFNHHSSQITAENSRGNRNRYPDIPYRIPDNRLSYLLSITLILNSLEYQKVRIVLVIETGAEAGASTNHRREFDVESTC
jgi:hypothetical protein